MKAYEVLKIKIGTVSPESKSSSESPKRVESPMRQRFGEHEELRIKLPSTEFLDEESGKNSLANLPNMGLHRLISAEFLDSPMRRNEKKTNKVTSADFCDDGNHRPGFIEKGRKSKFNATSAEFDEEGEKKSGFIESNVQNFNNVTSAEFKDGTEDVSDNENA